jgi:hypothetical protein
MVDYAVDVILEDSDGSENDDNREITARVATESSIQRMSFVYQDKRCCAKLYILFKLVGILTYSYTLPFCNNSYREFYVTMLSVMGTGLINSARHEYAHFKRVGSIFNNIYEFTSWKKTLWPKSRLIISMIELALKVGYLIKIFPPTFDSFDFNVRCEIGTNIFKLHVLIIMIIYALSTIFLACMFGSFYFCNQFNTIHTHTISTIHTTSSNNYRVSTSNILLPVITISPILNIVDDNTNPGSNQHMDIECCICLDDKNISDISMLICTHKFHTVCISKWLSREPSCPICRTPIL